MKQRRPREPDDPLAIPPFLVLTAAARRAAWKQYKPPAAAASTAPKPSQFAELAAQRKAEREAKRKVRIERALARKAVPDRIAAAWKQRDGDRMSRATWHRILQELPTASMRALFKDTWARDGAGYRRTVANVNGIEVSFKAKPQPAVKSTAPRPVDDFARRLSGLGRNQLLELAKLNGVFKPEYEALPNDGLVRMTVGNRVRAIFKRGEPVKWS